MAFSNHIQERRYNDRPPYYFNVATFLNVIFKNRASLVWRHSTLWVGAREGSHSGMVGLPGAQRGQSKLPGSRCTVRVWMLGRFSGKGFSLGHIDGNEPHTGFRSVELSCVTCIPILL